MKILNRYTKEVIYEDVNVNSFKELVEKAVKEGVSLQRANLRGANLQGATLRGADLWRANLQEADLRGVDLQGANLRGADLLEANLEEVKLWDTIGNGKEIKTLQTKVYTVNYTSEVLQIGCEQHPIEDWWTFSDERILEMDGSKALDFWKGYKKKLHTLVAE